LFPLHFSLWSLRAEVLGRGKRSGTSSSAKPAMCSIPSSNRVGGGGRKKKGEASSNPILVTSLWQVSDGTRGNHEFKARKREEEGTGGMTNVSGHF